MTDSRNEEEPITGSDPTNGLAGDLEGDDGGVEQPTENKSVFQEVISDISGDRDTEDENSATSYSEEGKP